MKSLLRTSDWTYSDLLVVIWALLLVAFPLRVGAQRKARLSEYISHFEGLSYDANLVHFRAKRSAPSSTPSLVSSFSSSDGRNGSAYIDSSSHSVFENIPVISDNSDVNPLIDINFRAHGRTFRLRLHPDSSSAFAKDLQVESSDGQPLDVDLSNIFAGFLEGEEGSSRVFGSLFDGVFEGEIHVPNATYYVERKHKYFGRDHKPPPALLRKSPFHSVIYSSEDVKHPYLDSINKLGYGCGSGLEDDVLFWMNQVSNSGVPGSEDDSQESPRTREDQSNARSNRMTTGSTVSLQQDHRKDKISAEPDAGQPSLRRRRSPGTYSTAPPSFSYSGRDDPNEDIWSRNAQSRISHDRKDFYPPPNVVTTQFPSSTVKRRACSLYIQTDTYLWDHIRKDSSSDIKAREEIASLVAQHIKAVNHIYENSDFKGIRGLKFIVQRLKINDSSSCDTQYKKDQNPFCSPNIDVSNFLNLNSQFNHNDFCLAYIFTYRDFSGGTLGLAWVASTSGASGGICEKYKSYTENIHGRQVQTKRSLNTGIITFVNYNSRVPPKVSELTLAHEIGHNFGSPHDYPLECRPGGSQGNFIMYSSATSGERPNNNKFSPCSIRNISSVLHAVFNNEGKENCFQEDDGPFCGNKIVEDGEECDCGYDQKECTEQCCYPREIDPYLEHDPNAKPCTRRRAAVCSPSEGPCCSESCRYERSQKLCRHESECTYESFCNGYRATCPNAPSKPNRTECNGGTQVCWRGGCVGSICQKYELEECFLTSKSGAKSDEMCEVACQKLSDTLSCRRTSEIHSMRNISGLKLRPGSPCNDFQGYCDVFQRCRAVDAEGPLARLKNLLFNQKTLMTIKQWITTYWWACMLMGVALMLFMAAFIKCCAVHTPSSNPKKKPALRITDTLRRPADTLRRKRHRPTPARTQQSSTGGGSQGASSGHGPSIPLQPSAPPPAVQQHLQPHQQSHQHPTQQQRAYPQQAQSHQQQYHQQQYHQQQQQQQHHQPVQLPQTQLIVALPPEHMNISQPMAEPPPPYPGLLPGAPLPPCPPRPTAPSTVAGPSHGYGEGRGHYNRRSHTAVPAGPTKGPIMVHPKHHQQVKGREGKSSR